MMSMRSRPGSTTSAAALGRQRPGAALQPVYEDFRPMIEETQEDSAHVLLLHLPGFLKEQIRILAESSRRILRIRGERLVTGNKWSRFQEEISVPEDCNLTDIRAKYERGILRITMPRTLIPTTTEEPKILPHSPPPTKEPETLPHSPSPARPTKTHSPEPITPSPVPRPPQLQLQIPPPSKDQIISEQQGPVNAETDRFQDPETLKHPAADETGIGHHQRIGRGDQYDQKKEEEEEEKYHQTEEDQGFGTTKKKIGRSEKGSKIHSRRLKLNEERQLLLNAGVAILVAFSLGAYISYSLFSSTD